MLIADILGFVLRNRESRGVKRVVTIAGIGVALFLLVFVVMEFDKLAGLDSVTLVTIIILVLATGFFSGKGRKRA